MECSIEDCTKPKRKRGWCEMHYSRYKTHGTPYAPAKTVLPPKCEVESCTKKPIAKNKCRKHYYAKSKKSRPIKTKEKCSIGDCNNITHCKGWCGAHYQRWRRFGDPNFYPPEVSNLCSVEDCTRYKNANGYCSPHERRWKEFGNPLGGNPIRQSPKNYKIKEIDLLCCECGKIFFHTNSTKKYCSRTCKSKSAKRSTVSSARRNFVEQIAEKKGTICYVCSEQVNMSFYWPHRLSPSIEHILPVSLGGTDEETNLAISHLTCNCSRQNKIEATAT